MSNTMTISIYYLFIPVILAAHLPPDFKVCKSSMDNYRGCLISAAQTVLLIMAKKGIPELNVPSIDPADVPSLSLESRSGLTNVDQHFTNVKYFGYSNLKVNNVTSENSPTQCVYASKHSAFSIWGAPHSVWEINFAKVLLSLVNVKDTCEINTDFTVPEFIAKVHFAFNGQLFLFPINSEGNMSLTLKNVRFTNNMLCEKYKKNGDEYIKLTSGNINFEADGMKFDIGTLIPDNPQLDKDLHTIIDNDPASFFEIIKIASFRLTEGFFSSVGNKIFSKIPLKEIFPQ